MTPLRKKEALQAELIGLRHILSLTPEHPLATPLMKGKIDEIEEEIKQIEEQLDGKAIAVPEAEIFFGEGPVIGSTGIDATFAGNVMNYFQGLVRKQFAAKFCGVLMNKGRITGEADSRLFLTALPSGSFGLQLSQPHITDWIIARDLTETMEDVTGLVEDSAKDDKSFVEAIADFNGRVLDALTEFLKILNNAGADCRLISGRRQIALKKEQVAEAYQRASSAEKKVETIKFFGEFGGTTTISGKFDFVPKGKSLITGRLGEDITEEQAEGWNRQFSGIECEAEIRLTTISTKTGQKSSGNELLNLKPIQKIPPPA